MVSWLLVLLIHYPLQGCGVDGRRPSGLRRDQRPDGAGITEAGSRALPGEHPAQKGRQEGIPAPDGIFDLDAEAGLLNAAVFVKAGRASSGTPIRSDITTATKSTSTQS